MDETKISLFGGDGQKYVRPLNVRKYIDIIPELILLPLIRDLFTNNASFVFQQDSTTCHAIIELLSCSGNSSDLHPIENLPPLENSCSNEVIMKKELKTIFSSMTHRCEAVIKNKGNSTKH
ncbi:UNVERIFIED_CONTAM: hypothetical protein NCL1_15144 [Trichonephila clavipes]